MIRSAKMNASTPPKLIPPFHSTAASGTFPIEQTKLSIATSGPIERPPELRQRRVVGRGRAAARTSRAPRRRARRRSAGRPTMSRQIAAQSITK